MATDALDHVRAQIGLHVAEIRSAGRRLSPLDLYARINAIRELAAGHGLATLERFAHRSAQRALLPGHRAAVQCWLEHIDDALDSRSDHDCTTILAALAVRLH